MTSRVLRARDAPAGFRELTTLDLVHYQDYFEIRTTSSATEAHWARAMFGDVADRTERFIWHGLLRLRLLGHGPSEDAIAGWAFVRHTDGAIMATEGPLIRVNLVFVTSRSTVGVATFVQYSGWIGRAIWGLLAYIHRALMPGLLVKAANRLNRAPR
ncbi:hypothetical protein [Pseudonocardia alni]|uniref:hypothetical protein n=1 Tax=Pseudonocardia alni TaxID=33907 RepID=UPI00280A6649|nr:hypothetical protein [Pseudonocardia alni]